MPGGRFEHTPPEGLKTPAFEWFRSDNFFKNRAWQDGNFPSSLLLTIWFWPLESEPSLVPLEKLLFGHPEMMAWAVGHMEYGIPRRAAFGALFSMDFYFPYQQSGM